MLGFSPYTMCLAYRSGVDFLPFAKFAAPRAGWDTDSVAGRDPCAPSADSEQSKLRLLRGASDCQCCHFLSVFESSRPFRYMPRLAFHDALNTLTKHLGRESAALELRWLKEAARDASHLHAMISRRVRGEPLQYILGEC